MNANLESAEDNMTSKEVGLLSNHKIFEYLTILTHFSAVAFLLFILVLCVTNEWVFFTWHPTVLAVGWVVLMSEGILLLAPNNVLNKIFSLTYKSRIKYHWIIQVAGIILSVAGFLIVFINKNIKDKHHFVTWHALIGLISVIFCIPALGSGILALYSFSLKNYIKPTNSKLIHRISGIVTFCVGFATVLLSLYSNWFQRRADYFWLIVWFIILMIVVAWTILQPVINVFTKLKLIR